MRTALAACVLDAADALALLWRLRFRRRVDDLALAPEPLRLARLSRSA